jgi:thioredoxin-like negative regulator of GroEL
MISVISDWVLATVRAAGLFAGLISVELILWVYSIRWCAALVCLPPDTMKRTAGLVERTVPVSAIAADYANPLGRLCPHASKMDKIAGLKEILELDPKNSFARYGVAMELASRGETAEALSEFDTLLANDPDYTAGYFMAAQTLAAAGRTEEAIGRLKTGILSAERSGNRHAVSEMQAMLDELDR